MAENPFLEIATAYRRAAGSPAATLRVREVGTVVAISKGIALVRGLPDVTNEELVNFANGATGLVVDLSPQTAAIALFDEEHGVRSGTVVSRTGRVLDVPVGETLLGRVIDPMGRPLDALPAPRDLERRPVERLAPSMTERAPIKRPLHTGTTVVDAMIPVGRGQRELVVGDRQTGKTSFALDTIIHQQREGVVCVYCAIGQQKANVARAIQKLRDHDALRYTVVVIAEPDALPGLRFVAPYAAMTVAEWFAEQRRDVLIVLDDLTQHAQAYRELALLLRRPPGREAFPGDIFYVHSRLLERATQLRPELGGGSITALPVVETEAQDISAYIPTNIVSITDGQIYFSPDLFQKGFLPAVDVGRSVSRVGGKAQLPTYRKVAGQLKLAYSQFEELERFARFGTRMDEETRTALEHGRRVRELLKQSQYQTLRPAAQIAGMLAVTNGLLAEVPMEDVREIAARGRDAVVEHHPAWVERLEAGEALTAADHEPVLETFRNTVRAALAEKEVP